MFPLTSDNVPLIKTSASSSAETWTLISQIESSYVEPLSFFLLVGQKHENTVEITNDLQDIDASCLTSKLTFHSIRNFTLRFKALVMFRVQTEMMWDWIPVAAFRFQSRSHWCFTFSCTEWHSFILQIFVFVFRSLQHQLTNECTAVCNYSVCAFWMCGCVSACR